MRRVTTAIEATLANLFGKTKSSGIRPSFPFEERIGPTCSASCEQTPPDFILP
jgi:hypothetical protein